MSRTDIPGRWAGTVQFALVSTPRSLTLTASVADTNPRGDAVAPWNYYELSNRGNKGATIFYALNGRTASSVLQSTFVTADGAIATIGAATQQSPNFRLGPDDIDRVYANVWSISALAQGNATTVYLNVAKY